METIYTLLVLILSLQMLCKADNPSKERPMPTKQEYERYLDQLLIVFPDPATQKLLRNATPEDIKNGVVERELKKLHPDARSKLDEVKRNIIDEYRRKLRRAKLDDAMPDDLYKFQNEDLKHLIKERHDRLEAMDDQRKKQFKKYEMEKELKHRMAIRAMSEYDRKVQQELDIDQRKKRAEAEKNVRHPGNKEQLEHVWEEQGFDPKTFNPKTFFKMHDLDGDGTLSDGELKSLFASEVEALFEGLDEDEIDEEEKQEEMEEMAKHVKKHIDTNKDSLITLKEFIEYTKRPDFNDADPWEALFNDPEYQYTDDEMDTFEKSIDDEEMKQFEKEAEEERIRREKLIRELEEKAVKPPVEQDDKIKKLMLNENIKKAIEKANEMRKLAEAKKLVADAEANQQAVPPIDSNQG